MSRRIIYKIEDKPGYFISNEEWDEVLRLQHWYNSEFTWTTGKLFFKRYVIFPNMEEFANLDTSVWKIIEERTRQLTEKGLSEDEILTQLERDRLISVKWGGYYDNCLASGFTRVADNEWNAFLVCDFLLKVSTLLPHVTIEAVDEGRFIRTRRIWFRDGIVMLHRKAMYSESIQKIIKEKRFFSIVDPDQYDRHPVFRNSIPDFNRLEENERKALVQNWNWLGYGNTYRLPQREPEGMNLNRKVRGFDFID